MRNRTILETCLPIAAACAALMIGCGTGDEGPIAAQTDTGTGVPVDAGPVEAGMAECTTVDEGSERACTCGTAPTPGRQICFSGKYTGCQCPMTPDGDASVVGGGALCAAGYYTGNFSGKYKPGVFGGGLFGSFIEFEVLGGAVGSVPALSFTLEKASSGGGGEFETFEVKDGCMVGSAKASGTNNPFVAKITGKLDCGTGEFKGNITGNYDFIMSSVKFQFTGPLSAQFQNPQKRLKDGIWNVKEPPALDGTPAGGGGGMWDAIWDSETAPAGEDPCASLPVPDGGTAGASDAGTAGASDAGIDGSI